MPMRESSGPEGGYGVPPPNPQRGIIRTDGTVQGQPKPIRLPVRRPPTLRIRRGR